MDITDTKKSHNARHSGVKAEKKKSKNKKEDDKNLTARQRNPKAFTFQSVVRAERNFRRTSDIKQKRAHVPKVDRTPLEPPPMVVAIVGPPKVGKSTLLRGLVRNFSRQKLTNIKGPVTVVAGKRRRLTFIECNNDINCMIDVGKIADLALLLVDAKQGFEMEIFEFFNICQAIGFPRCMGVLNHLDAYKDGKTLRKRKKQLKHRFEVELYKGARLFYLSMLVHGDYLYHEIHNLCRFISVMKMFPLSWRTNHPYVFADRMEDITNPEHIRQNPKCDRTVSMYGYVRGTHMKANSLVHLAGCGDYHIKDMTYLPDPCPTPEMDKKRRSLNVKERNIYAPMSGVGGIVYDKDAVYIDMGDHDAANEKPSDMVAVLMDTLKTVDEKMKDSQISIFKGGPSISGSDFIRKAPGDDSDDEGGDEEEEQDDSSDEENESGIPSKKKIKLSDDEEDMEVDAGDKSGEDDDDDDEEEDDEEERGHLQWKKNMLARARAGRPKRKDYFKLIYGGNDDSDDEKAGEEEQDEDLGGLFTVLKKGAFENGKADQKALNKKDSSCTGQEEGFNVEELKEEIMDVFMSGKWEAGEDAETRLKEDADLYGDFEDLEAGETYEAEGAAADEEGDDKDEDGAAKDNNEETGVRKKTRAEMTVKERRMAKKRKLKERFDEDYDVQGDEAFYDALKAEAEMQSKMNLDEFGDMPDDQRVMYEGFRPGMYVRIEFERMPCELVENFDPTYPLIVGAMTDVEEKLGYVNVRIKKHRWYKKVLKSRNPLILSVGWRRFQTIPYYYKLEDNMRRRMLKYTPENIHCHATFWGPISPQGTGFFAVESVSAKTPHFRIAATGSVLEMDKSTDIVKKLKLVGSPMKVLKNTAFIEKMFSSRLEVAKFEGAKLQTVSRLRGQIKKALNHPPGAFRATFEDEICMSDIVFLKTWVKVHIPKFIMPITSLLLSHDAKMSWSGMRTIGTIRYEQGLAIPQKAESLYKPVEREEREVKPFKIQPRLGKTLPFKDTPKMNAKVKQTKRVAVVLEPKEAEVATFMKEVTEIYKARVVKQQEKQRQRYIDFGNKKKAEEAQRELKLKEAKKKMYGMLGKLQKQKGFGQTPR